MTWKLLTFYLKYVIITLSRNNFEGVEFVMAVLKVVECKNSKKVVLLEKGGETYDAGGLFFELDRADLKDLADSRVLYSEEINYSDTSIKDRDILVNRVVQLEDAYGIRIFNNNPGVLKYWVVMNGVSKTSNIM